MQNYARITLTLSREEYLSLHQSAPQELRDGRTQARWLLRKALGLTEEQIVNSTQPQSGP